MRCAPARFRHLNCSCNRKDYAVRKDEALPGKFFKASDITKPRLVVLDAVMMNKFTNDGKEKEKPVAYFHDPKTGKPIPQGLVLNNTRWDQMVDATGQVDSADWPKTQYELFPDTTHFQGKAVAAISIGKPSAGRKQQPKKAAAAKAKTDKVQSKPDYDDDIPY